MESEIITGGLTATIIGAIYGGLRYFKWNGNGRKSAQQKRHEEMVILHTEQLTNQRDFHIEFKEYHEELKALNESTAKRVEDIWKKVGE